MIFHFLHGFSAILIMGDFFSDAVRIRLMKKEKIHTYSQFSYFCGIPNRGDT